MTNQIIIEKTIRAIKRLPDNKIQEVSDFVEFISKKYEGSLTEGMHKLVSESSVFEFLDEEEDLYSEADLKEVYDDKR